MRLTRHWCRSDDNDNIDGPTVHHRALDDSATDIHNCDRAAELDDFDDRRHSIDHDNHWRRSSDDIGLTFVPAQVGTASSSAVKNLPSWADVSKPDGSVHWFCASPPISRPSRNMGGPVDEAKGTQCQWGSGSFALRVYAGTVQSQ